MTVIEIAIFFNKLQYVLKPKATHRGRIKLASHIWNCECSYFDIGYSKNEVNTYIYVYINISKYKVKFSNKETFTIEPNTLLRQA